ncbi:MAG: hypothetical protein WC440_06150, partial [Candidatus Omnitrophota bacterium]
MKFLKLSYLPILALLSSFYLSSALAAETYSQSVTHAQNNIDNNTGFIPGAGNTAIIKIPQSGSTDFGLTYFTYSTPNDYLSSRTFTKSRYYFNSSTQTLTPLGDYTIVGTAGQDASWVTVGNDTTRFLDAQAATAATVTDLLERGLGMNNDASHNMIVEYAVKPDNDNL